MAPPSAHLLITGVVLSSLAQESDGKHVRPEKYISWGSDPIETTDLDEHAAA